MDIVYSYSEGQKLLIEHWGSVEVREVLCFNDGYCYGVVLRWLTKVD